jgi:hypothetical protein
MVLTRFRWEKNWKKGSPILRNHHEGHPTCLVSLHFSGLSYNLIKQQLDQVTSQWF